nr:KilA-N domain-containing protein [Verrucomicrobiota bacterium]
MNLLTLEYDGRKVHFTIDAWGSLTDMCRPFGKRPLDFLRLPFTKRYIDALERASRVRDDSAFQKGDNLPFGGEEI